MIGNDCKILEENIDTFLDVFVTAKNDKWESEKSGKIRHVLQLYKAFADLARYVADSHIELKLLIYPILSSPVTTYFRNALSL